MTYPMLNEIGGLLRLKCEARLSRVLLVTMSTQIVVALAWYAIDVKIPSLIPIKNNRNCIEYVLATCPIKVSMNEINKAPSTPVTRKASYFSDKPGTSLVTQQKHEVHQKVQLGLMSIVSHSTGVNSSTGSKRPASLGINDPGTFYTTSRKQIWKPKGKLSDNSLNKTKQIWKPKGKLSDYSLNKTKQVWKATGKLFANVGYQWRSTGKKVAFGKLNCGYQWRPTGKKFALGKLCPLTKLSVQCCSKHMTGNRSKLKNFVEKFIGSVRFGNDHFGAIMGYGDYVIGDSVISRVYYVEGLGHNLFSVGQFCDSDLEVAFRKHSCFVRDINGADLLKGSRRTNLYTISIDDMMKSSPICLLSKASKSKSWLWHRRLNHLNFGTINDLARKDLVRGLPRLKFEKDHLCSACQLGKSKKFSHKPKSENTNMEVLHTLHMDLCGPMRVQSINGKKYILVIVDDYSRFTWVKFLRSKDETPEFVINFLKQIQVGLNKTVRYIRTDNGTEFVNQVMSKYYEGVGIFHQKSVPRTPQQNGVVERRNRTLVEAARTMLIFSKAPMFLWAEAVATACYTQNRSLIHTRHNKTPYELVHDKKPDLTFLRVFGALCYPTNDSEDLGKFQAKADIGIFVGYAPSRKGYRIYNKRTRRLMETIHVTFDEMHQTMAPVRISSGPEPIMMTPGQLNSGLAPSPVPATTYIPPTDKDLEILFQPIASSSTSDIHLPVQHQESAEEPIHEDTPIIHEVLHPSDNLVSGDPGSDNHHLGNVIQGTTTILPSRYLRDGPRLILWIHRWQILLVRYLPEKQLASVALWCCFPTELSSRSQDTSKGLIELTAVSKPCKMKLDGCQKLLFWNGDLQEEVFVSQPEGFEDRKIYHVYRLKKSVWASSRTRAWLWTHLKVLVAEQFLQGCVDPTYHTQIPGEASLLTKQYMSRTLKKYGIVDLSDHVETLMVDRLKLDGGSWGFQLTNSIQECTLKLSMCFRYLKGPLKWSSGIERQRMSLTAYADADHAGCQDSREYFGRAQFLGDRLVVVIKEAKNDG
ncbi:retrovirus-related pol polyprotein from transposon TNT 1-94 [Tanacetum coccineum]